MNFIRQFKIGTRINLMFIMIGIIPIIILSCYNYYQSKTGIWEIKEQYLEMTHQLVVDNIVYQLDGINTTTVSGIYGTSLSEFWQAALNPEISNSQIEASYEFSVITVFSQEPYINAISVYLVESDKLIGLDVYYEYTRSEFILDDSVYEKAESSAGRLYYHIDDMGNLIGSRKVYYFDNGVPRFIGYMSFYIDDDVFQSIDELEFAGNVEIFVDGEKIYSYNSEIEFDEIECFYIEEEIERTSFVIRTYVEESVINEEILIQSQRLLGLAFLLLVLSLLVNQFIARTITRPVKILGVAVKKVSAGDFEVCVSDNGRDEIKDLVDDFNSMTNQIERLIHENYIVALQEKEYKLKYLRMQINPHFLYNTLDAMRFKALNHGEKELGKDIELLSDMFRKMIDDKQEITFQQEIIYIQEYVYFQKQTYGDKIHVSYDIDEKLLDTQLLKFILQPLIENSIYHGTDINKEYLRIEIIAKVIKNDLMEIIVRDNGKGSSIDFFNVESKGESHIGIKNIRNRIKAWYGERADLKVESRVDVGTRVTITIPMRKKDESIISR